MVSQSQPMTSEFIIGLLLATSSSIFIGSSFIIKKKGLLKLQIRAGQGGFGYLKEGMWWAGFLLMGVGEGANFLAYAFAPATLVTPLGALSVLVSAVMASRFLDEQLNLLGKVGCFVCVVGATVLVIHSPKEQEINTMEQLLIYIANPLFILYMVGVGICASVLIFTVSPSHGTSNPLVYCSITAVIGSLSVMGCKGLGIAIKETIKGHNQLNNPLTWIILFSVVFNLTVQMNYLNKALDVFNTAIVTPIIYVIFTSCVILASAILFKEFDSLGAVDIVGNICGFLTIVSGVFLLQAFKDMPISLNNLPKVLRVENNDIEDEESCSFGDSKQRVQSMHPSSDTLMTSARPPPSSFPVNINRAPHQRTSSFTMADIAGMSPTRKGHSRSLSYNKLLSSHLQQQAALTSGSLAGSSVALGGSMELVDSADDGPTEGITGYVKTERKHKRTLSGGSGKNIGGHVRTISSGSGKLIGHTMRPSVKPYYH